MALQNSTLNTDHFVLERLADGIYAALYKEGGLAASNAGIVDLGDRTLVFDTFFSPQAATALRGAAEELTGRPVDLVANSHWHHDHTWGNQAFATDTNIISTCETRRLIATAGAEQVGEYRRTGADTLAAWRAQLGDAQDSWQRRQCATWVDYFRCAVEAEPLIQLRLPDITFENRLVISGSQRQAELLTYAGHTENDMILFLPGDGIIFMGDLHFVGYHPYLAAGDPNRLLQSLREIRTLTAETFVPGHGMVGCVNGLALVIQYVELLQDLARQMIANGDDEERIMGQPIPSPFEEWLYASFFTENLSALYQQASQH